MKITREGAFYFIEKAFPKNIICGFTTKHIDYKTEAELFSLLKDKLKIASLNQQHSTCIHYVDDEGLYKGDGLFTKKRKLLLIVKTADCLPLYFYDFKKDIVGIIHLGWRGAKEGILDGLDNYLSEFGIIAGVGLRVCCYRVGKEFLNVNKFKNFLVERNDELFFDSIRFVKENLKIDGSSKRCFYDVGICSFCNDNFYSWRREKTEKRTFSFIYKL
ncbi:MAG: hypothetical protein DRP81_03995 [Candidatus Omnitrophota bacterium]|nr:MAG: hypothetical protein DRP81_03995 [Candidatus Omnitrophota bacterium]HDN86174.1 laccase domain-containing protein [Candidatus Omnitrophota bacterium]